MKKFKRIYLEITNACNLNCPFCRNDKGQSFMSLKDIEEYLLQIKDVSDYLYLHVLGEPLLHQDFEKILNLLDKYEFKLQLVTNGVLLKNYPHLLKHQCLRKIAISLHSLNNLEKPDGYFETIRNLINENKKTIIELRFYGASDDELSTFKDSLPQNDFLYVTEDNFFKWPSIEDEYINDRGFCHGGKDMLAVLVNGDVTLCCLEPKGHNKIGNLKETKLKDILNNPKYLAYLNNLDKHILINELCQKCTYRLRFK